MGLALRSLKNVLKIFLHVCFKLFQKHLSSGSVASHVLMILFLLEIDQFLQNDSRCQDGSLKYILIFRVNKSQEQQAEKKSFVLRQKIFFRKYKPQKTKLTKLVQKRQHIKKICHWTWIACRISTLNPVKTHNARKSSLTTPWRKSRLLYHHFQVS